MTKIKAWQLFLVIKIQEQLFYFCILHVEVQCKNPGLETESDVSSIAIVWFPMPSEMQSSSKAPNYEWEEICNYKMYKN